MKPELILCLAGVLSGGLFGCSTAEPARQETVTYIICKFLSLTNHARAPLVMEGGTTFHFVTDGIRVGKMSTQLQPDFGGIKPALVI